MFSDFFLQWGLLALYGVTLGLASELRKKNETISHSGLRFMTSDEFNRPVGFLLSTVLVFP